MRISDWSSDVCSSDLVPFFPDAGKLPAEDAVALSRSTAAEGRAIKVAVPQLARIANFDDLDPLIAEPDVAVDFFEPGRALPGDADLVVLPGSKATLADLAFLREQGRSEEHTSELQSLMRISYAVFCL